MKNKVKIIAFALIIALCTVSVVSAKGSKEKKEADTSLEKIKDRGSFIMGLDDSFPPMGFRDENNNIVGYDIDLATEVCKRLGLELKLQPIDWAAKEQELNTGKIDCIWNGFTMTPEREEALAFTKPYLDNAQVVIVRDDSGYKTLKDLEGKIIGLQAGSSAANAVESSEDFSNSLEQVVEFKDNLIVFMDLARKGIDGAVMDMVVGNYNIKKSNHPFIVLDEHLISEKYGIGFRKKDLALRDAVQVTLEEMAADGTVAEISTKWFDTDISVIGK